jgi:tRNA/tmRNA/rRNA uracil-C5-methylase (TrmA/RlmC/RlmD family)
VHFLMLRFGLMVLMCCCRVPSVQSFITGSSPAAAAAAAATARRMRTAAIAAAARQNWVDGPFAHQDEVELKIEDLTNLGDGVGKVTDTSSSRGRFVVMVPGVMPGEVVRARVRQQRKTHALADLVEVVSPSPARVEPVCSLFGVCGGCQYQFMPIGQQRDLKRKHVVDALERIGGFRAAPEGNQSSTCTVSPVVGSAEIYGYRTKLTPHHNLDSSGGGVIGFQAKGGVGGGGGGDSMRLVDVPHCPLATPELNERLMSHREAVREAARGQPSAPAAAAAAAATMKAKKQKKRRRRQQQQQQQQQQQKGSAAARKPTLLLRHALKLRDDMPPSPEEGDEAAAVPAEGDLTSYVSTDPNEEVFERVGGLTFRFRAGEFFQNNPFVVPKLVDHVIAEARAPLFPMQRSADESGGAVMAPSSPSSERRAHCLIDAYCGGGLFCLSAAPFFERCAGIEISKKNIASAQDNAELNGIRNAEFVAGTAEGIFATIDERRNRQRGYFDADSTVVIVDPPRKGCSPEFLQQLAAFGPARVVYVSCDPSTQARDARELVGRYGYAVGNVTPFDLFPQTRHIENVMTFDRAVKSSQVLTLHTNTK